MTRRAASLVLALGLMVWGVVAPSIAHAASTHPCLPPVPTGSLHPLPGLYVLSGDDADTSCVSVDTDVAKAAPLPRSAVLLVHGLDDSGDVWRVLAPALRDAGRSVLFFEYPNDQAIALSADALAASLRHARARGVEHIDLVCHSMGGLVTRDLLTRTDHYAGNADGHADLPDVGRMILIGTPNRGAPLAYVRDAGEVLERTLAWRRAEAPLSEIFDFSADGDGQAGIDLRPGSAFLTDLNARPAPVGVVTTVIIAQAVGADGVPGAQTGEPSRAAPGADAADAAVEPPRGIRARFRSFWSRVVARVVEALGDGAVPLSSATLDTADETLLVRCSHLGLLKEDPVGAWVLDHVGADRQESPAVGLVLERVTLLQDPAR